MKERRERKEEGKGGLNKKEGEVSQCHHFYITNLLLDFDFRQGKPSNAHEYCKYYAFFCSCLLLFEMSNTNTLVWKMVKHNR